LARIEARSSDNFRLILWAAAIVDIETIGEASGSRDMEAEASQVNVEGKKS